MSRRHIFIETNFLFHAYRMPSKRHRDVRALMTRFEAGEVKFYAPYVCFQEARNLIGRNLPTNRCTDLWEFHRHATAIGTANWDSNEVKKFLDAATGEVRRTRDTYQRDLADFAAAIGEGLLHGTDEVFDFLESLNTDDALSYNDKLILSTVLLKANELRSAGESKLYFVSVDKSDLQPTEHRPKLSRYYAESGLTFVPGFVLPDES